MCVMEAWWQPQELGWMGTSVQNTPETVPLEHGGRVGGQGLTLWLQSPFTADFSGGKDPLSFRMCLHLGWVEGASLLQH